MQCPICRCAFERKYCRTCGNDSTNPSDATTPGVTHLVEAYAAKNYPREDYQAAVAAFSEATKYTSSFSPVLAMVTWFEYAMAICTVNDGGPLKKLSPSALRQFVQTLEQSQSIYNSLADASKQSLSLEDYPSLFRSNLNEARRVQEQRGETERLTAVLEGVTATPPKKPPSPRLSQPAEGEDNGDNYTYAHPYGAEGLEVGSVGIRCVKCTNHVIPLSPCGNCGGVVYLLGTDKWNVTGLACLRCSSGFTSVRCVCGCENPIRADTIMRLKKAKSGGGCFIATAACGNPVAPEVVALSAFRDQRLSRSRIGRGLIRLYYVLSPPIALVIGRSPVLRRAAMSVLIQPVVRRIQREAVREQ